MFGNGILPLTITLMTIEIFVFRHINSRLRKYGRFEKKHTTVSVALCLITMFITINLLIASDYHKSKVDATPLAELTTEEVCSLEEAVRGLESSDNVTWFEATDMPSNAKASMIYYFNWRRLNSDTGVRVNMLFYRDEIDARNRIANAAKAQRLGMYRLIKNVNGTEALLLHAELGRNEYFLASGWLQMTYIRLGSTVIILTGGAYTIDNNAASEFIEWMCGLLKDSPQ